MKTDCCLETASLLSMLQDLANKRAAARHGFSIHTASCSRLPKKHSNGFAQCPSQTKLHCIAHDPQTPRQHYKGNNYTDTNTAEKRQRKQESKNQTREENKKKTKLSESFKSLFFFLINRLSYLRTKMQCNHKVSQELSGTIRMKMMMMKVQVPLLGICLSQRQHIVQTYLKCQKVTFIMFPSTEVQQQMVRKGMKYRFHTCCFLMQKQHF